MSDSNPFVGTWKLVSWEVTQPLDFQRMIILSSYCEFTGKLPERTDPASQNHVTVLQGIATEAKRLLGRT